MSGFHGGEDSDCNIQAYNTVHSGRWRPIFRKDLFRECSGYKSGVAGSTKTFVTTYQTIRCHNPEDYNIMFHYHVSIKLLPDPIPSQFNQS
jgi:hypothetical protein